MKTLIQSITDTLWHPRLPQSKALTRTLIRFLRYPFAIVRDAADGELNMRAMSLVYTTLLALVPLIALSFSILKAFDFHYEIEPVLNNLLAPLGSEAPLITQRIISFVENVKGSTLGSIGLALLIYTVFSMVQKVEESFNFVWQVTKSRSLARRFSEYISLIVVAPVLMLIAVGIIGTLSFGPLTDKLLQYDWIAESTIWLSRWTPLLFITIAFTFIYSFIPNTQVSIKAALIGGLTGAFLWTAVGELFSAVVAGSARTEAIYSTFAILVLALIWLYIGWLILLIGAKVSYYVQNPQYLRYGHQLLDLGNAQREEIALALMRLVARDYQIAGKNSEVNDIARELQMTGNVLAPITDKLIARGLLLKSDQDYLVPAVDINRIALQEVIDTVREQRPLAPRDDRVGDTMRTINSAINTALDNRTVRDLLDDPADETQDPLEDVRGKTAD